MTSAGGRWLTAHLGPARDQPPGTFRATPPVTVELGAGPHAAKFRGQKAAGVVGIPALPSTYANATMELSAV